MAIPVDFRQFTPTSSRRDLLRRLEAAPEQHVEALLASYELMQRMHDEGLIDLANGLLSAGSAVMSRIGDLVKSPETVIAIRATFMLAKLLREINPELHQMLSDAEPQSASPVNLVREMMSEDARVGLATSIGLLKILGAATACQGARTFLKPLRQSRPASCSHGIPGKPSETVATRKLLQVFNPLLQAVLGIAAQFQADSGPDDKVGQTLVIDFVHIDLHRHEIGRLLHRFLNDPGLATSCECAVAFAENG